MMSGIEKHEKKHEKSLTGYSIIWLRTESTSSQIGF